MTRDKDKDAVIYRGYYYVLFAFQEGGTNSMLDKKELYELSGKLVTKPNDYMTAFRRNVSLYIDQKEITLQEVAELADISLSTLKSFLYGDSKDCSLSLAVKLSRVFNVTVDELIGAGTMEHQTCNSLQTLRKMPESFTHFLRWEIQFHHDMMVTKKVEDKLIDVMRAKVGENGNMLNTNNMDVLDISHLSDSLKPKVFMGIKIPNNMYNPEYYQGDILLLANDRAPFNGDRVVICYAENLWILECRYEPNASGKNEATYYSIRDGGKRATANQVQFIMGYIAKVERG